MGVNKELLSEVLFGRQKIDYIINKESPNLIYFQENNLNGETVINKYELMHLMKEWAYDNKYSLLTQKWKSLGEWVVYITKNKEKHEFIADTEPEAVEKACEWIRKQKEGD